MVEVETMWRLLMSESETACLTCPVRPVNPFESLLASSQYLECENLLKTLDACFRYKPFHILG